MAIKRLLQAQDGVVARRQVLASGATDNDIERLLRRREWAVVHPGVYVTHTGPLPWRQRAWAALLAVEPAALAGPSALRVHGMRHVSGVDGLRAPEDAHIHVAVDRDRHVKAPAGVVLTRRSHFDEVAQLHLSPPRLRLDEALVDVADAATRESDAVAVLADACQQGRTTPDRLLGLVRERTRLRQRRLLVEVLDDVSAGVRSVLEQRYVRDVERPHAFPTGRRQRRVVTSRGPRYRDVEYREQHMVVELDGRLVHSAPDAQWQDLERDVDAAMSGETTVRLGWVHVAQPCRTAAVLATLLHGRGWCGAEPCSPPCPVGSVPLGAPRDTAPPSAVHRRHQAPAINRTAGRGGRFRG